MPKPTTTIRIEDQLKSRIAAAAERAGKTPHAFSLDAIAQTGEQHEQDAEFQPRRRTMGQSAVHRANRGLGRRESVAGGHAHPRPAPHPGPRKPAR